MNNQNTALRIGRYGAIVNIAGILLSGPLSLVLVLLVHPNPAWQSPAAWAANFHPIQTLPYFAGFLLLGGCVAMMAATHQIAEAQERAYTRMALVFTAAFVVLIFLNYITQTTFLPALARDYRPEYDALISGFSFSNPRSLCWAIEMWGYALLGVATILAAPVFRRSRIDKVTAALMVANGILSLAGAFIAAWDLSWVLHPAGLVSYVLWNALVLAMVVAFWLSLRERQNALTDLG